MNPALKTIISYSIFIPVYTLLYGTVYNQIEDSYPLQKLENIFSLYVLVEIIVYSVFLSITKYILNVLLLVPSLNQAKVVRKYLNGNIKDEWFTNYFDFGNLRRGEYRSYYPDGTLKEIKNYSHLSKRIGEFKSFDEKGNLTKSINYNTSTNFVDGLKTEYHKNGKIKLEENYKEGQLHGIQKYYYENGNIKLKKEYVNGNVIGLYEDYYENGNLKRKYTYAEYVKKKIWCITISTEIDAQGLFESYHENGSLKCEGKYVKGKKEGLWKDYHQNGQLEMESTFTKDKKEGLAKAYNERGVLKSELEFKDGVCDGPFKYYHENGSIAMEGMMNEDGLEGPFKVYSQNGILKREERYSKNKKDGTWYMYHEEYKIVMEFSSGDIVGKVKFFNKEGELLNEISAKDVTINDDGSYTLTLSVDDKIKNSIECPRCLGKGHVNMDDIKRLNRENDWLPGACQYCNEKGVIVEEVLKTLPNPDSLYMMGGMDLTEVLMAPTVDIPDDLLDRITEQLDKALDEHLEGLFDCSTCKDKGEVLTEGQKTKPCPDCNKHEN